jgi:geranylgeranyl reductase
LIKEFDIPLSLLVARINSARMVAPSNREVDMPIKGGFVGMVDRDAFDEWLRNRAQASGAIRRTGNFHQLTRDTDGTAIVHYISKVDDTESLGQVRARAVIGADGARSLVAKQCIPGADEIPYVFAYHEIVRTPPQDAETAFDRTRCDIFYQGALSPDFYGWVFPHGETTSVGMGTAQKGFSMRQSIGALREAAHLDKAETIRREGAPIPLRAMKRWDNGRDVVVAGDAAGVVAPASGEGIYYAMVCGRLAAEAVDTFCATGDVRALRLARKRFMKMHRTVFFVLGIMQHFWYSSDKRRERFVNICRDEDVQQLTWEAYMHKKLVRAKPLSHVRIFFKDLAHLAGVVSPW